MECLSPGDGAPIAARLGAGVRMGARDLGAAEPNQ
jgi:hypothetical protein